MFSYCLNFKIIKYDAKLRHFPTPVNKYLYLEGVGIYTYCLQILIKKSENSKSFVTLQHEKC